MRQNTTRMIGSDVAPFLHSAKPARRATEAPQLDRLFRATTGFAPRMWGWSIVGYRSYHYRYVSGRQGEFLTTGFSPGKARLSIYIMPGYRDFGSILARLGRHQTGVSCLCVTKLAAIDMDSLAELIRAGLRDLSGVAQVHPTRPGMGQ